MSAIPVVVVEVVMPGGSRWFSDGYYVDAAAGIVAEPRISARISFERVVTTVYWGGSSRAGIGAIELENSDGNLDNWFMTLAPRGVRVIVYIGTAQTPWSSMTRVATAMIDRPESIGESRVRLPVLDTSEELTKQLSSSVFTAGPLSGKPRPVAIGQLFSVPAQLSDFANARWSTADIAPSAISAVRDKGYPLTVTTQWVASSVGEHVGFTLLQSHVGRMTADTLSPPRTMGSSQPAASLQATIGDILIGRAGLSLSDVVLTELVSLNAELSATGAKFGLFADPGMTVARALDAVCNSFGGWWYRDLDGVIRVDRLRLAGSSPALTLTESTCRGDVEVELDIAPGLSTGVNAMRNVFVHSTDELAASVLETEAAVLLQQDYRATAVFTVADVYADARGADRPSMHTQFADVASLTAESAYRVSLWSAAKWWYSVEAELDVTAALTLMPGDTVRLPLPRFGLDAGPDLT